MLILKIILILPDVNIKDNIPTSCSCEKSKFRYEPYGHTLSRDLYIKEDRAVINLFCEMDLNIVLFQLKIVTGVSVAGSFMTMFFITKMV